MNTGHLPANLAGTALLVGLSGFFARAIDCRYGKGCC